MEGMEQETNDEHFLQLSPDPIRFESVSSLTNVFFDDSKQQVFAVRSGGVTGVLVKGPNHNISFRMEDKGPIISIKFSPDMNILAIQRSTCSVEFINYSTTAVLDNAEYSQSCKKNASILGFVWTHGNEIAFFTDHGVELFLVLPEKKCTRALKSVSLSVHWFLFCPRSFLALLSSGSSGNQMQALYIGPGNLQKITKFELEANVIKTGKLAVSERDVALAVLYGVPRIIILRHQPETNRSLGSAFVYVYTVHKMIAIKKTHVLRLDMSGKFAINVIDNLIIVHHQASKTSIVFDIMLTSVGVSDGSLIHHTAVAVPKPIKPHNLKVPGATLSETIIQPCQLYSSNWVIFQPNIVIDARLGCLWYIELRLGAFLRLISDKVLLIDFLLQREDGKPFLIQVLQNLMAQLPNTLIDMSIVFEKLNSIYRSHLESEIQCQMGTLSQTNTKNQCEEAEILKFKLLLDQSDMYGHIFAKFPENTIEPRMIIWVLLEYIRSLTEHGIPVQHYLHELVITTLVQQKAYYQLHQLLQYHVITDSKPLACLLLSLETLYPAAHQLALDMLKRLENAHEEIVEVLLSKGHILPALRYIRSVGIVDQVSARKFLEVAKSKNDDLLFHSVYEFFEQRNLRLHNTTAFQKGEHCQAYEQYHKQLFYGRGCRSISDTNTRISSGS